MTTLKVAVGRRSANLSPLQLVWVHGEAHGAARFPPFKPGSFKDFVESFCFGGLLDPFGTGYHKGFDAVGHLATLGDLGRFPQIAEASVGAAADETDIDGGAFDGAAGGEVHVGVGFLGDDAIALRKTLRPRYALADANPLVRRNSPGNRRFNGSGLKHYDIIVFSIGIAAQALPPGDGLVPIGPLGGKVAVFEIVVCGLIRIDVAAAGTAFDGHVAHGHALFHGHLLKGCTSKFVGVTDAAFDAEFANEMQNHIFGIDPRPEAAVDFDAADFEFGEGEGLGGEDVADLAGADPEGDRPKGPMGGGMAVSAGNGHAGLGEALLGGDDMDDALAPGADVVEANVVVLAVLFEGGDHFFGEAIGEGAGLVVGGNDVIDGGDGAFGEEDGEVAIAQHGEGLGTGDFVDEVEADEELGLAGGEGADGVEVPDFVEEGACAHGLEG